MLWVALLTVLVSAALAQNLEECSSGGPEFWCASCNNAEACSALIPGLVEYCEQIGIFQPGKCTGGGTDTDPTPTAEDGTDDVVTILPTRPATTDFDGEDDALAPTKTVISGGDDFLDIVPQPNPDYSVGEVHPFPSDGSLEPPYINIVPRNITVPPGATAQFRCAAEGAPAPTITITPRDEATYTPPKQSDKDKLANVERSNVNIIQEIEDVTKEHEGWYRCLASNVQGAVYYDAYLRVLDLCATIDCAPPKTCEADYLAETASCVCPECDTTFDVICGFDCNTYFNPCQLEQKNCQEGTDIGIWNRGMCPAVEDPKIVNTIFKKGQTGGGMKLKSGGEEDDSDAIMVASIHMVNEGDSFDITCQVTGSPAPTVSWWFNDEKIHEGDIYSVSSASPSHDGVYTCQAVNCIYGGDKENIQVSEGIQVNIKEVEGPAAEPLGRPCQVFGDPHIVTFDNKLYDYMGDCNYVLSMDCDWGEWVVYGNFKQCGPTDLTASCLIDVTVFYNNIGLNLQRGWIVVYRGEKVKLVYKGEVMVEDIKIRYDGLYITVELPNGILVTWDGIISTQIILDKDSTRNTCGLCGNNDQDPNNEFYARFALEDQSSSINAFGNSWEIDRLDQCNALTDEVLAEEFCRMYPERAQEGAQRCPEVFNNAVFDPCREYLPTDTYEEKCRFDFCAMDELREILLADCGVAAAYVQQCFALSGMRIAAADWRAAVNCPTIAEHQNNTLATGCPQDVVPWTIV